MNLSQFLSLLRARWRLGVIVLLCTIAAGVAYSLLSARTYTASSSVMVEFVAPDMPGGFSAGAQPLIYMASQVDLINSERVALKAVELLGLQSDAALRERWLAGTGGSGDFKVWLAGQLSAGLEVRPSRESNLITVRYTSEDAQEAARAANAFVRAYAETSLDMRVEPTRQFHVIYEERAVKARADLEAAQLRLSEHQRAHKMIAGGLDGRVDLEAARLSDLSSQLVQAQGLASESQGRRDQAARGAESLSEVRGDPTVAQLRIDLSRDESQLNELSQRLGDNHPQVLEQRARIGEVRERLARAIRTASGAVVAGDNVNKFRVAQLQAAIDAQREKVLQLKSIRDSADVLQRDVDVARQSYESVLQRLNQTELASHSMQTNVSVLQVASAPLRPTSPKTLLNTVAALLAGSVLGLSAIVLAEVRDRRIRTPDEVVGDLQQPLLLTMPKVHFLVDEAEEDSSLHRIRSAVGLPARSKPV